MQTHLGALFGVLTAPGSPAFAIGRQAEALAPDIADFLGETVTLEVNGEKTDLGTLQPIGWPVDASDEAEEKNYGQTLLSLTFRSLRYRLAKFGIGER